MSEPQVELWQAKTATEALGELWNSTLFVWNALFADGHYEAHSGLNYCELCEMWTEMDRALVATVDAVAAAGFEPVGYGFRRVGGLSELAERSILLWGNDVTKCQAMCGLDARPDDLADVLAELTTRSGPEEATEFVANLERHRAETTLWGCRA